jgi:hypothetical protein
LQLKREEFELAATTLQGVETMNPEVEFIYFYLGNLYEATGNISVACQMYKRGSILLDSRSLAAEKKCK